MRLSQSKPTINFAKITSFMILASLGLTSCSLVNGQLAESSDSGIVFRPGKSSAAKKSTEYLRVTKDASGNLRSLQTAITRFRAADSDVIVDLIGAVHIGERDYYRKLNSQFDLYDVVLYELVAPQGTRVPAGGKKSSANPLGLLQQSAQKMLGLESQLALIDYQKKNFVHADMSPAQIGEKMDERGDNAFTIGISAITEMMRNQNKMAKALKESGGNSLSGSLASESLFELMGNPLKMKQMMAQQFSQSGVMEMGLGETLNRMLIDDRNSAAVKVLRKEMAKDKKTIAIFYGAAHMPDFEKRLAAELGLKPTKQVWLNAWDLTKAPPKSASPTSMLFDLFRQFDQ